MATVQRSPEAERHDHLLQELLGQVSSYNPKLDADLIRRAFDFACDQHAGQLRKSGEDFIHHPWSVAQICAGMKLDSSTIAAALMHDVIEDTDADLEQVRELFGDEVALLVEGVTKLSKINFASREQAQAENYRKMIMAMAQDVRVVLIKLADRLHNMRTIEALPKQKQTHKASETLEIYAPLAHRLGIHSIKWELEDRAFQTLHPRRYTEIESMVNQRRGDRERYVEEASTILSRELDETGVEAEISGRAKHYYSIYSKMAQGGKEFNEIYDLTAMRVLVDSVKDCYGAIGVIHSLWKPMPGRFKDYVAMPKFNMYQSLHTTVIGPEGKPLEIQVRTQLMHQTAEYGIAAHWLYKDKSAAAKDGWLDPVADAADGLAERRPRSQGVHGDAARRPVLGRGLRVHAQGRGEEPAGRVDAARLRLRRAHRRRPPLCGRQGQRPHRAAALHAALGRLRRGADLQAGAGAVPRLAEPGAELAGRATRSASGSASRRARISSRRAASRCTRR